MMEYENYYVKRNVVVEMAHRRGRMIVTRAS